VICPIGEECSEEKTHSERVMDEIIEPIAKNEFGYNVVRADKCQVTGQITSQIIELIVNADLLIADLSFQNPNVFYELALRHITRKPFIHLIKKGEKIPFDIKDIRAITFDLKDKENIEKVRDEIREQIMNVENGRLGTIQYISILLGELEIIFHALKYFVSRGLSKDNSRKRFGKMVYKDKIITNLDFSKSRGDKLELKNINANRIDASNANLGIFYIKDSIINLLDISGCEVKRLTLEDSKINIMDASGSSITIFTKKKTEIVHPDFSEANVLEER